MFTSHKQISPPSLVLKLKISEVSQKWIPKAVELKRIPTHKKCKCKKFCSQTRLVGEIYSSDVIMHRGYWSIILILNDVATQVLTARASCCQERFLTLDYRQTKWVFYLADSVLEFIVGYFKIIIDNYTMKITRFFSWSKKEKELEEEMINLGCLPFTQIIRLDILCVTMNKFIK